MTASSGSADLLAALVRLHEELAAAPLALDVPGVDAARSARQEMVGQLEDYILPRLVQIDAPLLTVVGGSTGAGKSTLVNTLVGHPVTASGVLRPTTRSPVLVHNPADVAWFQPHRVLPDLARTTSPSTDVGALHLVAVDSIPEGLAILDAPDVDSVEVHNRQLAAQLLAAADLWLFVTSAARYADQVPWAFLLAAAERSTAVAIVLDRTAPTAVVEVRAHLEQMLIERGLEDSPLFTIPESRVDEHGLLPTEAVADIRRWLDDLAVDSAKRARIIQQTLDGAIRQVAVRTHAVADAVSAQQVTAARLREDVNSAYRAAADGIAAATSDGTMLRGEVLARWQEFVGAGEFTRSLEQRVGRLRDRLLDALRGRPQTAQQVTEAVEHGLQVLLVEHAESAAERAHESWSSSQAGRAVLGTSSDRLGRASRDFREKADRAVRDWQGDLLDMVRAEGAEKRTTARVLAYGVNGLGVALMVLVFSQTAGLTGGEAGIAGGTALLGQKVLEAVFGDQAVRTLADRARADLNRRARDLLDVEAARYLAVLEPVAVSDEAANRVRDAARAVDAVRNVEAPPVAER